jgi:hypothetical protein
MLTDREGRLAAVGASDEAASAFARAVLEEPAG